MHYLGSFYFHVFHGTPSLPFERILGEVRAGRNGHDLWAMGAWADPFPLETRVGVLTYAHALNLTALYHSAVATEPLPLMLQGILLPGVLFKILTAPQVAARALVRAHAAGDSFHYQGLVTAQWQLLAVAVAP